MQLKHGTTLQSGRFKIISCIGDGGFGITYLVTDERLGREVVLKEYFPDYMARRDLTVSHEVMTLSPDYSGDFREGIRKFLKEAKTLAQLNHIPAIANVHDFFEENNTAYIVMDYIKGQSLKQHIKARQNPYSFSEALSLVTPCMEALEQVHQAGIIHRDFAPDNILIDEKGRVKIIDFGASRDFVANNATMTIMVKHGYAPVEQYSNAVKQGPYTDVYSLGAIFYEMLTLQKPMPAVDRMIKDSLATPIAINTSVTEAQSAVVMKGLAVSYESRYQSVGEFLNALRDAEKGIISYNQAAYTPVNVNAYPNSFNAESSGYATELVRPEQPNQATELVRQNMSNQSTELVRQNMSNQATELVRQNASNQAYPYNQWNQYNQQAQYNQSYAYNQQAQYGQPYGYDQQYGYSQQYGYDQQYGYGQPYAYNQQVQYNQQYMYTGQPQYSQQYMYNQQYQYDQPYAYSEQAQYNQSKSYIQPNTNRQDKSKLTIEELPPVQEIIRNGLIGDTGRFGKYEWKVLAIENGKALITTAVGVYHKAYNTMDGPVTWENCTLRKWLNEEFFGEFSEDEQALIATTWLENWPNPKYGTYGGNNTEDKIFLLSLAEARRYFADDDERAISSWWWLRTPGQSCTEVANVFSDGTISEIGNLAVNVRAVRPALWMSI